MSWALTMQICEDWPVPCFVRHMQGVVLDRAGTVSGQHSVYCKVMRGVACSVGTATCWLFNSIILSHVMSCP